MTTVPKLLNSYYSHLRRLLSDKEKVKTQLAGYTASMMSSDEESHTLPNHEASLELKTNEEKPTEVEEIPEKESKEPTPAMGFAGQIMSSDTEVKAS